MLEDYTQIYHLDLHGNVRKNPKLSGTTHNVFGIQVGVGITIAIRKAGAEKFLKYYRVPENWTKLSKTATITEWRSLTGVPWNDLQPNIKNAWLTEGLHADFEDFLPMGSKETKTQTSLEVKAIFKTYSSGAQTNRDDWMYDFDLAALRLKVDSMITTYNDELVRWKEAGYPKNIDDFVLADATRIKWSSRLKEHFARKQKSEVDPSGIRNALYRPFTHKFLYFDNIMTHRQGVFPKIFPIPNSEAENIVICVAGIGAEHQMMLAANHIVDVKCGINGNAATQCFPLYTYALDGKLRRDNITDWALTQFRAKYGPDVTKRDIFHYVYGLLHSPEYRERYKENLKRELPRIPLVGKEPNPAGEEPTPPQAATLPKREGEEGKVHSLRPPVSGGPLRSDLSRSREVGSSPPGPSPFQTFVAVGAQLAALHVGYEQADEYDLKQIVSKDVPFSWRVTKMRLNKEKTAVVVNEALTLAGIPPEAFDYKLGNRSALEWVLDQYQVSTDKRTSIVTDPNRAEEPDYIARLVRRVITVSVETARLVQSLPHLTLPATERREKE